MRARSQRMRRPPPPPSRGRACASASRAPSSPPRRAGRRRPPPPRRRTPSSEGSWSGLRRLRRAPLSRVGPPLLRALRPRHQPHSSLTTPTRARSLIGCTRSGRRPRRPRRRASCSTAARLSRAPRRSSSSCCALSSRACVPSRRGSVSTRTMRYATPQTLQSVRRPHSAER